MAEKKTTNEMLAVVLIRGRIGVAVNVKQTLDQLGLDRKNACAVVPATAPMKGMLMHVKDYATFGVVSGDVLAKLTAKSTDKKRIRCALAPPRGGFERKGTKMPYSRGGALGDRGEDMNALLTRML